MGKLQGFHVILTGFSWFNSWDFPHGNTIKKHLKSCEILMELQKLPVNGPLNFHF